MSLTIVKANIVDMHVDAIVNAANRHLLMGGGVCGAIFRAAGAFRLQAACLKIHRCNPGRAVITDGYELPCKFIIHTVGPVYRSGSPEHHWLLHSCYQQSIILAQENQCRSIAFPLISSGIYGYPKKFALSIAIRAIQESLLIRKMEVFLVLTDERLVNLGKSMCQFSNAEQRS